MKFEIYGEQNDEVTRLRLIANKNGIVLCSVDEDGEPQYYILGITNDGELHKYPDIGDIGLCLDDDGRILDEESED